MLGGGAGVLLKLLSEGRKTYQKLVAEAKKHQGSGTWKRRSGSYFHNMRIVWRRSNFVGQEEESEGDVQSQLDGRQQHGRVGTIKTMEAYDNFRAGRL